MIRLALPGCLMVLSIAAGAQGVSPVMRYNSVSEFTYQLERCNALTPERRAWLDNVRGHALRALAWNAAQLAAHDAELKREFDKRYPTISPEKCAELARGIDSERANTRLVP